MVHGGTWLGLRASWLPAYEKTDAALASAFAELCRSAGPSFRCHGAVAVLQECRGAGYSAKSNRNLAVPDQNLGLYGSGETGGRNNDQQPGRILSKSRPWKLCTGSVGGGIFACRCNNCEAGQGYCAPIGIHSGDGVVRLKRAISFRCFSCRFATLNLEL